ncbi:MAG: SusC/RagA family TonB-linked outer membrane protein [Gemmatimonadota bacterium]|nr:SusC/RagA family TonB-linked outer membrane protein [Gemmatimonadota bacterium]
MRAFLVRAATGSLVALLLASAPAMAQTGRLSGTITDATTRQPVPDAQISVVGTSVGGATNLNGAYQIDNVPLGSQRVRVRRIGFAVLDTTITIVADTRLTVGLQPSAAILSQVVVTGTPQATERRALGNAVTQLDVATITEQSTMMNVTDLLQSKAPGVTVMPGSGTPGTAAEINIRGSSSFLGNKPIVYIDGIRYNTNDIGNFVPSGAGLTSFSGQTTSALDIVSPNDIESIEIIKGPSAATLYGAEAAGGVIQIITKKGTRGQQRLRWTAKVERGTNEWGVDHITNYTTCDSIKQAQASTWPGCVGVPRNTIFTDQPMVRDPLALREGDLERYSLSVRGGGDRYGFYISGDYDLDEGVFHNSHNGRRSIRTNFSFTPNQQLDFTVNVGYVRNRLRLPLGDESFNGLLLSASRGKPGRVFSATAAAEGWGSLRPEIANRYNNQSKVDRVTIGSTFNYAPLSWLRNRLTLGMDYTSNQAVILSEPLSADSPLGLHAERIPRTYVYTVDYAASAVRGLTNDLESTTSVGAQATANKIETLAATGSGLGSPDVTTIGSAQTSSGSSTFSENNNVGFYFQQQLGWKNRLYVTGAVRADDNSSFGTNFDWIVYPKASMSWVLSEEPMLQNAISSAKIDELRFRAAWGQAGRAPAPYSAVQTYTVDRVTFASGNATTTQSALRTLAFGNPDLKPERGDEFEVGLDVAGLDGKVGAEFTYYEKLMKDLIIAVATPPSQGFASSQNRNMGRSRNSGVELAIFGTPVRLTNFTWDARLNVATNKNKLLTLGPLPSGAPRLTESVSGQSYAVSQVHRIGYPLGGYWARFPRRNADGSPVIVNGAVQFDTSVFVGRSQPSREIGFSTTFTLFKYFRIFGLLDYKGGHYLLNIKEWNRCLGANDNCAFANNPRVRFPQTAADSLLNKELAYHRSTLGWSAYLEKADFTKLRDLSLTIMVPERWAARAGAQSANVVLAGHNLTLWTDYTGLDPEVNNYSNRAGGYARADVYAAPMTKRYSFALQFTY